MSIEDKARGLVDSFMPFGSSFSDEVHNEEMCRESAQTCAIIAVNEILKITFYSSTEDNDYWKAVKQEIIKM